MLLLPMCYKQQKSIVLKYYHIVIQPIQLLAIHLLSLILIYWVLTLQYTYNFHHKYKSAIAHHAMSTVQY
jgi:hypothetical protein